MNRSEDVKYPAVTPDLPEFPEFTMVPRSRLTKLNRGEDPKPDFIPYCKLQCKAWGDEYGKCEKLRTDPNAKSRPETCLYIHREWMECVERCVQPKVLNNLYGVNSRYHFWF